jgi:hypothetical protein
VSQPLITLILLLGCAAAAQAQDRAEIERTPIVGNRELPKVLYIVPWKQPLPGVPSGKPLQSVLDEALTPLDRAVFRRQLSYGLQLKAQLQAGQPAPSKSSAITPPATLPATPPAVPGESR